MSRAMRPPLCTAGGMLLSFSRSVLILPVLALGAGSCNSDSTDNVEAGADASDPLPGSADASSNEPAVDASLASCSSHQLPRELSFTFEDKTRSTLLAGPQELPNSPLPLIINFHGYSDGPESHEGYSEMSGPAVTNGYVVAYPKGTGIIKGWNGGACCGSATTNNRDDVGFTEALIDEIANTACIDREKVYAVGYSNGGFLAHRLACELSDKLAGVASVAGVIGIDTCSPERAIPLLQIHGSSDATVPYGGSILLGYPSVNSTMADWAQRLGCDDSEPTSFFDEGDSTCVEWSGCNASLARCRVQGGGHTWPGGTAPAIRGHVSEDLDATEMIWQFFSNQP